MRGIVSSQQIAPSLASASPKDVRYGEGQYFSDIPPGTKTGTQLSRTFLGLPFRAARFTHYVEIDVTGLPVVVGRQNVFLIPGAKPLDVSNRISGFGSN